MAARKVKDEGYPRMKRVRLRVIEGGGISGPGRPPAKVDHRVTLDPNEDTVIEQQALLRLLDTRLNLMDGSIAKLAREANCAPSSVKKVMDGKAIRPSLLTILRLAKVCRIRISGIDLDDNIRPRKR